MHGIKTRSPELKPGCLFASDLYLGHQAAALGRPVTWRRPCLYRRDGPVHAYRSISVSRLGLYVRGFLNSPLEVVWPRVFVFPIWTKGADIARRVVDKPVPDHFIFTLEPLPPFASWAPLYGAVMGSG